MKILMLDISGKVTKYTFWVTNAIFKNLLQKDTIKVYTSMYKYEEDDYGRFLSGLEYKKMLNLVPLKYKRSFNVFKRFIKSIETIFNYIYIIGVVIFKKIDVLHTQYNPFADFISLEYYIYKIMKFCSPKIKLVLTIHDVLPHNLKKDDKKSYCERYAKVASIFDAYMVHTESCKNDVIDNLRLPSEKVYIAYHPIFESVYVSPKENNICDNGIFKIIMFGLHTPYKGTDILIDALNLLPKEYVDKFEVIIAGTIEHNYLEFLKAKNKKGNIKWYPYFLPEQELDEKINNSNIIVLPYRSISQSGVLLLSLFFRKLIITSDLPSFVESLEGYEPDWFFESENPMSLAKLFMKIIDGEIDVLKQQEVIDNLNKKYSLRDFAERTISVYHELVVT